MKGLPGISRIINDNEFTIAYQHKFSFKISREYPQELGKIKIVNQTPLVHPRIVAIGANACYSVNGEIDRILVDIIYNVLLRPETVRPPSLFKDADWGLDAKTMRWYINYGPQKIFQLLWNKWSEKQTHEKSPQKKAPKRKVQFLD